MKNKSWHLDRKTFLRGSGIALSLPYLNAMTIQGEAQSLKQLPKRVAFSFFPNGVSLPPENDPQYEEWHWFPKGQGRDFSFRTIQNSLNPFRNDLSVLSGLSNPENRNIPSHMGSSGFLSCRAISKNSSINAQSIDQVISQSHGRNTPLKSLVLSSVGGVGSLHRSYTLSYDSKGRAIPAMSNLRQIYEKMYLSNSPASLAKLKRKVHLLNAVYHDAKRLHLNLGIEDQKILDEYLTSISDLEKKLEHEKFWIKQTNTNKRPQLKLEINFNDVENYIQTMYEMIYLSFKADITRVATYQIASEGGESPVGNMSKAIGIKKDLHSLSHGASKGDRGYIEWGQWDQFIAKQFSIFLNKLRECKEGDGCLLDRCLILHGSATGKSHDPHNYPLILAGGKKLGHRSGQFITYPENEQALSNLFVKMANAVDIPLQNFADSNGRDLKGIFA